MNYLTNLPNDIHLLIYKHIFNKTLIQLQNTINGIQKNPEKCFSNIEQTFIHNSPDSDIDSRIEWNGPIGLKRPLYSKWAIPIKSYQNQHIYQGITRIEYINPYLYYPNPDNYKYNYSLEDIERLKIDEDYFYELDFDFDYKKEYELLDSDTPSYRNVKGNTWQNLYETSDNLISSYSEETYIVIIGFKRMNQHTLRLITTCL